ncbi:PTS sugar transporter subunit IIA [Brevibacillus ginsengisoli]|uniref:PTS sugar transporter subunit IIA n=1 Tax=Brevibacillus ginsengisoli TaxID=363854 RepID=UPI003CFBB80D
MFGKLFSKAKEKEITVFAPLSGEARSLEQVPDPMFAQKVIGDGVAIQPSEGILVAPAKGKIVHVATTLHAIGLVTDEGLEILCHIGIDTVKMDGQGFTSYVKAGDTVNLGDKLISFDLQLIESAGYATITPIIITNGDKVAANNQVTQGNVQAGRDHIMKINLK